MTHNILSLLSLLALAGCGQAAPQDGGDGALRDGGIGLVVREGAISADVVRVGAA